ncbi:hypothetical protein [Defluviimonas sp. WL0075]|uniref:Glycerol-3-phosphate dehydrogenase n=1 Tax=Albidovulum sediminicola TaxID=2984331 RepID=A0ABT2Z5S4_9RHOB|nr:hypothetical protein [Defluviimonas sp. WL0075]MCV2866502.1 hypothetical protein [Defluviimonas sp. WL0075]
MSDPRTNLDVEDVLSSIRRLVSQDTRAADGPAVAGVGKLVLTPSLRVNDAGEVGPSGGQAVIPDDSDAGRDAPTLEETIDELEAAVAGVEAAFEADAEDDGAESETGSVYWIDAAANEEAREAAAEDEDLASRDETAAPEAEAEAGQGDVSAAADAGREPAEEDVLDAAVDDEVEDAAEDLGAESGDDPLEVAAEAPQEAEDETAIETEDTGEEPVSAAETVDFKHRDTVPPEAEADVGMFFDAEPVDVEVERFSAETMSVMDPGEIDEDLLRAMVAALVREELQGALGERLTDRLRKLVRREVQLALGRHQRD